MNLVLPTTPKPVAAYIPAVKVGNLVFVSGQVPAWEGELRYRGKVGSDVTLEEAVEAARLCTLNGLAAARSIVDLDDIERVVKVVGFVNSTPEFHEQPLVINGASELLLELFGPRGQHARSAVSCNALPLQAAVEIEFIFAVHG